VLCRVRARGRAPATAGCSLPPHLVWPPPCLSPNELLCPGARMHGLVGKLVCLRAHAIRTGVHAWLHA